MGIGPLSQGGLDEALGFSVGFGGVGSGADVPETQLAARVAEGEGLIATAVVGHDPGHGDAEACVIGDGGFEERDCAGGFFVRQDLGEGVIDADVDELPTEPFAARPSVALTPAIACDAMSDLLETAEFYGMARPSFRRRRLAGESGGGRDGYLCAWRRPRQERL